MKFYCDDHPGLHFNLDISLGTIYISKKELQSSIYNVIPISYNSKKGKTKDKKDL